MTRHVRLCALQRSLCPDSFAPALFFAALGLAFVAAPAFAQRGSAPSSTTHFAPTPAQSHIAEGVARSSDAHVSSAAHAATRNAAVMPSSGATRIQPAAAAPGAPSHSASFVLPNASLPSSAHVQSTGAESASSAYSPAEAYKRQITIGFPPVGSGDSAFPSSTLLHRGTIVEGQRNEFWAVTSQRAAIPQHPSAPVRTAPPVPARPVTPSRPVASPRATLPPQRVPVSGARFGAPIRRSTAVPARPFWFLTRQPAASSPPRVFGPRRRRPSGFQGFGFFPGTFGFGFPFVGFGFFPDCNPFWAWPWAYGCASFGYWNGLNLNYGLGYTGGFYTEYAPEESQEPQETQPSEEPGNNIYIPPPEPSSPDEIEAEKSLTVLFMKNGAVYAVTDYWVADGKLHYLTAYGAENTIDMNDLDLQKTVDANANRGVSFTLKAKPDQNQPQPPQDQPNPPEPHD